MASIDKFTLELSAETYEVLHRLKKARRKFEDMFKTIDEAMAEIKAIDNLNIDITIRVKKVTRWQRFVIALQDLFYIEYKVSNNE
jgi:hypothetical protein